MRAPTDAEPMSLVAPTRRSPAWRRYSGPILIVVATAFATSCTDDGTPEDQPATVTDQDGTVETPSGGTTRIEAGTNLTPTSDAVPNPTATDVPGLGDGSATTD